MKLTKENIVFLDNYLKRKEIIYYDIRMELLDHILSAVGEIMSAKNINFYDALRFYIIANKKELLVNNRNNMFKEVKTFFRTFTKPYNLFLAFFSIGLVINFKNNLIYLSAIFWIVFLIYLICNATFYFSSSRKRFYTLEKGGKILSFIYCLNILFSAFIFSFSLEFSVAIFTVAVIVFLSTSFLAYYLQTILKFRTQKKLFRL